jgi:protein-L-isoaspartate(D-aspartate) O-methyltransferase
MIPGWILCLICLLIGGAGCSANRIQAQKGRQNSPMMDIEKFTQLRERMVRDQLKARDISDVRVLAAMKKVPRHEFVPEELIESAYEDRALPLKFGQTISQPYIVAYMTQALNLQGAERVLEIGTGSGYQAAILAELVRDVYTIEIVPQLHAYAEDILSGLGYRNIHLHEGDGYMGWPEQAPFDRIIVTAAPLEIPQPLLDQLKEGGRLIIPLGSITQELVVFEKTKNGISRHPAIPVRFVPMTGKAVGSGQ